MLTDNAQCILSGSGRDRDRLAVDDAGPAADDLHAILLEQCSDTAGELGDDAVLPSHRLQKFDARCLDADPERRILRVMADLLELPGGMDQGLGRNASDVEAGPAEFVAFDERRRDAELRGADRCDIATRTAADDEQRGRSRFHRLLHEQGRRAFQQTAQRLHETGCHCAVDHTVIER